MADPVDVRPPSPAVVQRAVVGDSRQESRGDLLVILGAEGTSEYGARFGDWCRLWEAAAERGSLGFEIVGELVGDPAGNDHKLRVQAYLEQSAGEASLPLWIVLIGHGTFDGRTAKFNLVGEDFSVDEFAAWLAPLRRPVAVLNCASASGPFLEAISGPGRVVATATKSGGETNVTQFGGFLAAAAVDPASDLDKDQQVSLLEIFLRAARQTEEFYAGANRIATEHAQIDDDGDARGSRAAAFRGVRPIRQSDSGATLDGLVAHQWTLLPNAAETELSAEARSRRDAIELQVLQWRERKAELDPEEYYSQLERLLVELARVALDRPAAATP